MSFYTPRRKENTNMRVLKFEVGVKPYEKEIGTELGDLH